MSARDLDALAFGETIIDLFPPSPGVAIAEAEVFHKHLGGAPANVAVGMSRLGARAGLMTLVGDDDFGRFLRRRLVAEGVDVSALGTHPTARTGITFVAVADDGARSFLSYRGGGGHPAADQLVAPEHVDPAAIARARIFHFGSSTLALEAARAATDKALEAAVAARCVVSMDPNWRAHLWRDPSAARPLLRAALSRVDVLKISDDELGPIVDTADPVAGARALRALGAKLVVVTRGGRGCLWLGPAGDGAQDGERVPVVDTTGAGDGFVAGLLASLAPHFAAGARVEDLDAATVRTACALGNRVGARTVSRMGATAALPRLDEL